MLRTVQDSERLGVPVSTGYHEHVAQSSLVKQEVLLMIDWLSRSMRERYIHLQ